jgi:putative flippase GtrA
MADPSPGISRTAELARIARFGAVGLLSTAIYMGLFALVTLWLPPVPASVLAYVLSALVNFVMQSRFTFRQATVSGSSAVRFVLMHLFCMGVNSSLLWVATGPLALPALPAQTVIVVFVAGLSYLISRFWVYSAGTPGTR